MIYRTDSKNRPNSSVSASKTSDLNNKAAGFNLNGLMLFSELMESIEEAAFYESDWNGGIGEASATGPWTQQLFLSLIIAIDELSANLKTKIDSSYYLTEEYNRQNESLEPIDSIQARFEKDMGLKTEFSGTSDDKGNFHYQSRIKAKYRYLLSDKQFSAGKISHIMNVELPEEIIGTKNVEIVRSFETILDNNSDGKYSMIQQGMPDEISYSQMANLIKFLKGAEN